ncbi:phosphoribosyltransferase family protein [Saliphagus sp. GCM10025308]
MASACCPGSTPPGGRPGSIRSRRSAANNQVTRARTGIHVRGQSRRREPGRHRTRTTGRRGRRRPRHSAWSPSHRPTGSRRARSRTRRRRRAKDGSAVEPRTRHRGRRERRRGLAQRLARRAPLGLRGLSRGRARAGSRKRGDEGGSLPRRGRGRNASRPRGKRVVVVDDGVATGATAIACLRQVREAGAAHVTLAVPVGSPDSISNLEDEADAVVALQTPAGFRAVGQFYRRFNQVSDEEAMAYLDR